MRIQTIGAIALSAAMAMASTTALAHGPHGNYPGPAGQGQGPMMGQGQGPVMGQGQGPMMGQGCGRMMGGGYGPVEERDSALVLRDVREAKVSLERARTVYKVAVDPGTWTGDETETARLLDTNGPAP